MPLVAAAFSAYAAGLLLGFGGVFHWAMVAIGVVLIASAVRRNLSWVVLALVAAGGVVVSHTTREDDLVCQDAVRRVGAASVRLWADLAPGRSVRGTVQAPRCGVNVRIGVRSGEWPSGAVVHVEGEFARRGSGLDVRDAHITLLQSPSRLSRIRASTARRIEALYGRDAPLAKALLLADANDIDRELRDRFADAGIIHMLSVSGLHVAIIADAVRALASASRLSAVAADGVALAVAILFVGFIGAPPPAARSAGMLALGAWAKLAQRPTSSWGIWAVSCAMPLVEPRVVVDLGWQLSAAGMAGLLASGPLSRRLCTRWRGWRRRLADSVVATAVASAITAPLVAWVFGRVSLAAVATNLAAAPLFGVAQPLLFASLVVGPLQGASLLLAEAGRSVLFLIDLVARWGAALPLAALRVEPNAATAALLGVAAVAGVVAMVSRWPRRPAGVAIGALALAAWLPIFTPGPGTLQLHAVDVGQGDALALRTPRGRWFLIDAGGGWRGGDAGASIVWPYLRRYGGDVVFLSLSHPHLDHLGGAVSLLERAAIDTVWDGAYVSGSQAYRDVLLAARRTRSAWRQVAAGDSITLDGVTIQVLAPDSAWMASRDDPNEASVVLRVSYGEFRALYMGDAEHGEEGWLVARYGHKLRADVLKVGHHGSATSSTAEFLDRVRPRIALVSVGQGNTYGHPSSSVLQALNERGAHLLRTDDDGTIVVSTDGHSMVVQANGSTWQYFTRR